MLRLSEKHELPFDITSFAMPPISDLSLLFSAFRSHGYQMFRCCSQMPQLPDAAPAFYYLAMHMLSEKHELQFAP